MREVVWTRAAETDLQQLFQDIETIEEGAADEFLLLIDASIQLLREFPEMAPKFCGPVRRLVLNSRLHGVFYAVENRGVIIHGVADLRRDPIELRERFRRLS